MTGRELAHALLDLDMTQRALAAHFQVHFTTVNRWCVGRHAIPGRVADFIRARLAELQAPSETSAAE